MSKDLAAPERSCTSQLSHVCFSFFKGRRLDARIPLRAAPAVWLAAGLPLESLEESSEKFDNENEPCKVCRTPMSASRSSIEGAHRRLHHLGERRAEGAGGTHRWSDRLFPSEAIVFFF